MSVTFSSGTPAVGELFEDGLDGDAADGAERRDGRIVEGDDHAAVRRDQLADRREAERLVEGVADGGIEIADGLEAAAGASATAARDDSRAVGEFGVDGLRRRRGG